MDANFWTALVMNGVGLYLTHRQVRFMEGQRGVTPVPKLISKLAVRRYWPMGMMVILMLACWIPSLAGFGQTTNIPEFDEPLAQIILGWGQDSTTSCFERVNSKGLISRQNDYKLAIGCFVYDGKEDMLDAPYVQVSNLYDISGGTVHMRASYQPDFIEYANKIHTSGIIIALLNVPNGVQPTQFTTLRQARALGVKILTLSMATAS